MDVPEAELDLNNFTNDHVILFTSTTTDQPNFMLKASPATAAEPTTLQTPSRTKTLRRLAFSKPKSRFSEPATFPFSPKPTITIFEGPDELQPLNPPPEPTSSSSSCSSDDDDDDDEWLDGDEDEQRGKHWRWRRNNKINKRAAIEWTLFLIITTCLVCSLTIEPLACRPVLGLMLWKWCVMVLVLFCGRLVSGWAVGLLVFLIERNFMLREKVLYFVYGLRRSFQNCAWLGLVLVAWVIMFPNVRGGNYQVVRRAFRILIAVLVAATFWLVKIVLVKVLASSFHVTTFFDRMKESVFHHYVLDALSGPPLEEEEREAPLRHGLQVSKSLPARLRGDVPAQQQLLMVTKSTRFGSRKIDMEKLKKLSMKGRPTAWTVKRLVNYVRFSGLSTISRTVDDFTKAESSEINSEREARSCAHRIFKNVANPGAKYIEEEDLLRFLKREEVHTIFPLFEGAMETGRITKSSFRNWVVHAYFERKALAHSLNDTKTAVQQLHKLASAIVVVIIIIVSLLVLGLATTKVIFVVTSQLLLVGFMFQNTCKTVFESIIFVFVMHPFDVGDRCVIDGIQMIVEEMNILTTVFLRYDMEKIYYPNSVLLTKPISNFRRSPDMADTIDFAVDVSTSIDTINALKKAIQSYIESKPKHWSPKHSVIVKEIENVNKMKMCLCVQHTMNHQNYGERSSRKSELILELKKMFENLDIKYHLLPQEIHLSQVNLPTGTTRFANVM
ncbi:mechanosensitive ion channel protein 10-like [Syzygium oleosum]|uniref:mechanosensitive ion channel protein 10-like n=1 Tax=Syzygium oleosum TaxID=219896 RepID=UPI0024BBE248|nr:mechanosensitive ion channel protein 10-like [Syzygium oleosum]